MADKDLKVGLRLDVKASGVEQLDRTADAVEQIGDEAAQAAVQATKLAQATEQVGDAGAAGLDAAAGAADELATSAQTAATDAERLSRAADQAGREGAAGLGRMSSAADELRDVLAGLLTAGALTAFVRESMQAARQAEATFRGLESTAKFTGAGVQESFSAAAKLSADGLLTVRDASQSLQNLLSRGYSLDEAIQTITRLKDAAAFNRAAHVSLSEAVRDASEGLKSENSILVDNAGVTKNVAKLWEEYADRVGKSVDKLTQQEKVQAEVNGILRETQGQLGNAAKAAAGAEGAFATLNKTLEDLKVSAGNAFLPLAEDAARSGKSFLDEFVKPFLGGVQIMGASAGLAGEQFSLLWERATGKNVDMADWARRWNDAKRIMDETGIEIAKRWQGSVTPAVEAATAAVGAQAEAERKAADEAARAAREREAAQERVRLALKELGIDVGLVGTGLTRAENEALGLFDTIAGDAEQAAGVLRDSLIAALGQIESPQGLAQLRDRIAGVIDSGRASGPVLQALRTLLAEVDGAAAAGSVSSAAFAEALGAVRARMQGLAQGNDLGNALAQLGVDLEQVRTGLAATERDALGAFAAIAGNARASGREILASLVGALARIETPAGARALQQALTEIEARGRLSGRELAALHEIQGQLSAALAQGAGDAERFAAGLRQVQQAGAELAPGVEDEIGRVRRLADSLEAARKAREAEAEARRRAAAAGDGGMQQAADGARQAIPTVTTAVSAFSNLRAEIYNLSQAAGLAYDRLNRDVSLPWLEASAERAAGSASALRLLARDAEAAALQAARTTNALNGGIGAMVRNAEAVKAAFFEASAAVLEAQQHLEDATQAGTVGLQDVATAASLARSATDLLDAQQLDGLNGAIESARQKLAQLKDEAAGTLAALRDELDQLNGDEVAIENRRAAARQLELRKQLDAARAAGDAEAIRALTEAGRLAEQIHARKLAQIREQAEAERTRAAQSTARTTTTAAASTAAAPAAATAVRTLPVRTVRLEIPGVGTLEATEASANRVLDQLGRARSTSL